MTPTITLHEGDCRVSLRRLIDQGVRVHSVVTDPPYGLVSVTKRFGKEGAAPAKHGTDGAFSRASKGFMGKQWDGTGIERDPEFWRLIYEILLPGGMVFAFSGARTGHWQACAMEVAGFIMHPMHGWLYGSGMPKAHNPCPGIDKAMGVEGGRGRPKPGHEGHMGKDNLRSLRESGTMSQDGGFSRPWMSDPDAIEASHYTYAPGSPEAKAWDGWRYGTQTQKPALEPVYLGQKPFGEKTGVANLLKHGVGAFNVDGCRVPTEGDGEGRWPANVLHDDSEAVRAIFPDSKGQQGAIRGTEDSLPGQDTVYQTGMKRVAVPARGDTGSAARFFNSFPTTEEDYLWAIDAGLIDDPEMTPAIYHGKATKADRAGSKHPTVKPIGLMEHFIRHITPPGGTVLDPFGGSGTTAEAARRLGMNAILMEAEPDYIAFLRERFDLPAVTLSADILDLLGHVDDPVENDLADLLG